MANNYNVTAGETSVGITLDYGDFEYVSAGGTTIQTTVNAGAQLLVYSGTAISTVVTGAIGYFGDGGSAISTTVQSGAQFQVAGSAEFTVVSGGTEFVVNSGIARASTVSGGFEILSSGGTATDTTVLGSGTQLVLSGGTATDATITAGGAQKVRLGGIAIDPTVNAQGFAYVTGTVTGATVNNGGGVQIIGSAFDTTVNNGGTQTVYGVASGTLVNVSGSEIVAVDGLASGTIVYGDEIVSGPGATTIDATVYSGGDEIVIRFGTDSGTILEAGSLEVSSGGHSVSATVNANGNLYVWSGGSAIGITVNNDSTNSQNGGTVHVLGGSVTSTTLNSGRTFEVVSVGGVSIDATVNQGGQEEVLGGTASGAMVNFGGGIRVLYRGRSVSTTLDGGRGLVDSGSVAISTTVNSAGQENVLSGGTASGAVVNNGGTEAVFLGGAIPDTELRPGGAIDLASERYVSGGSATIDLGTNILTVIEGDHGAALKLAGNYANVSFHLGPDGSTGTLVTRSGVACFRHGTRLRTDHGEVAVETLSVGDALITRNGEARHIRWIGHRRIDCRRHPVPDRVWPVWVGAGAFGDAMPHTDLWLSPDHAVFVNDVLIPVRYLINGGTIAQVPEDYVEYYHVELAEHDLVLAEGLLVESYLDAGDRENFDNANAAIRLFPDFSTHGPRSDELWELHGCASLVTNGPKLDAARRMVRARAAPASGIPPANSVPAALPANARPGPR